MLIPTFFSYFSSPVIQYLLEEEKNYSNFFLNPKDQSWYKIIFFPRPLRKGRLKENNIERVFS